MYQFLVADMTCGHCVSTITRALKDADAEAKIDISLGERRVIVRSRCTQEQIADVIREAGYAPHAT
jgi:copper chaperone